MFGWNFSAGWIEGTPFYTQSVSLHVLCHQGYLCQTGQESLFRCTVLNVTVDWPIQRTESQNLLASVEQTLTVPLFSLWLLSVSWVQVFHQLCCPPTCVHTYTDAEQNKAYINSNSVVWLIFSKIDSLWKCHGLLTLPGSESLQIIHTHKEDYFINIPFSSMCLNLQWAKVATSSLKNL